MPATWATESRVAISHGIVIRKWMPLYRDQPAPTSLPAFVPLKAVPKRPAEASVKIELPVAGVPNGSATAKTLDYSLKCWVALKRYLDDAAVPIDNNQVENQIRPWALGRSNLLFAESLRSGKRAAVIMSLIQSARMNGHDPYAYLRDVLTRLPTQRTSDIEQLLPHQWVPATAS
jgi:hypothetical protein|tara:strand:+ start:584 stop:1108 length:525 start_codon:yes stop_codon:yes gene_type:complete